MPASFRMDVPSFNRLISNRIPDIRAQHLVIIDYIPYCEAFTNQIIFHFFHFKISFVSQISQGCRCENFLPGECVLIQDFVVEVDAWLAKGFPRTKGQMW